MGVSMWRKAVFCSAVIFFFFYLLAASVVDAVTQQIVWKDVSSNIKESDLHVVTISPNNPEVVFTGSSSAIYKTIDGGKSWNEVMSFKGTGNTINSIVINPLDTNVIYAGTQDGLFRSKDHGKNWKRIFGGIGELESSILSIAISPANPELIFIGTKAGLFWTDNRGADWKKGQTLPSEAIVPCISLDHFRPNIIYAATERGLYKSINSGMDWERILETNVSEGNSIEGIADTINETEATEIKAKIRSIAIDPTNTNTVYLGTSEGLFITEDDGLTWKMVSSSGLISSDIRHLVISSAEHESVYAATSRGVFRYSRISKMWEELYKGLTSLDIRFLASVVQDKTTTLWTVTKRGIFKTTQSTVPKNEKIETDEMLSVFAHEPSITEIQKAAIRYAEVHPEKIEGWRKAASRKAWLPDLTIRYDRDRDWQSSTYFYSTASEKYKDDDITRGKDFGWSVSLTWELGDLIWNDDQTSIDTRSRLMVQLRDDVLNEVTRLYFERRRLQIEMLTSPPENLKDRIEKELRLQELTADIDALTDFCLSKTLSQTSR